MGADYKVAGYYLGSFLGMFTSLWWFVNLSSAETFLVALAAAGLVGCLIQELRAGQTRREQAEQGRLLASAETSETVLGETL